MAASTVARFVDPDQAPRSSGRLQTIARTLHESARGRIRGRFAHANGLAKFARHVVIIALALRFLLRVWARAAFDANQSIARLRRRSCRQPWPYFRKETA